MFFKTGLALLLMAMSSMVAESSWGEGQQNSDSYDLSKSSELTKLYNTKVFLAEKMRRPLAGLPFQLGALSHAGVRVTLEDGTKWLLHKGGYTTAGETVITDARYMSDKWRIIETRDFRGSRTVSDFVGAGGIGYKFWTDNCHDAANRMMDF